MARKSRKHNTAQAAMPVSPFISTALYIRLSVEDNNKRGNSIETQKLVLEKFLFGKPELRLYDIYIDNGATGTNFNRDGFQRMLSDIESGKVGCVIVKDLSRLGRNAIDTGYYIERYFPSHNVRFISVTDQFDSENPDNLHGGIILPLKNMINEAYALDIGRKIKAKRKIVLDVAMTLALLFLMGYPWWGDVAHEWAGAGMFALFIAHHILNAGWWRSLGKGRYTPARVFQLVIDLLVLPAMLGLMVSGVILSNHVFAFLPISGGMSFARLLHMASAYWGFVLMSLHLGLHWNMILGMVRRAAGGKPAVRTRRIAGNVIGAAVAVYGLVAFVRRGLPMYLFVQTHFVFFDYSEPIPLFYLDYLAMMGTCIFLAHWMGNLLRRATSKKSNESR